MIRYYESTLHVKVGCLFFKPAQTTLVLPKPATGFALFVTMINSTAMKDYVSEKITVEFAVTVPNDAIRGCVGRNMPTYTHREMADMHLIYGMAKCNGREALRMYRAKYPGRQLPSRSFFATLHRRLCETGSFNVHKLDTGRQRTTRTVDAEDRVLQELERNPSTSTRVVSRETHIPQATVWRIAHDEGLHPYHLQRVQALELGDYNKRMDFARWFLHESNADRNFAASVLFTDEATFSLEGVMNFHNLHTWADENPHAIRPNGTQRKCSINHSDWMTRWLNFTSKVVYFFQS
ncbi:transposable element tc3 transposase [Trichonephila clavipes]|nr:transposable element tc3 transposase [Trichonephila clavipes]